LADQIGLVDLNEVRHFIITIVAVHGDGGGVLEESGHDVRPVDHGSGFSSCAIEEALLVNTTGVCDKF
jgi:hypothetical protein